MLSVVAFSETALTDACADKCRRKDIVNQKPQLAYLARYLREIGCKTILIEDRYIDRDFLDDFAAYYVRCYHPYGRECRRLHFFGESFSETAFKASLSATNRDDRVSFLKSKDYQGFVVLKPLPDAFFGKTCLKHYPDDHGRRRFPMVRTYTAHVAGVPLQVSSLAFQEQDTVMAACATSAIWSTLHKTCPLFEMPPPTPSHITTLATRLGLSSERALPSQGLDVREIRQAIKEIGLECEIRSGSKIKNLRGLLYAYGQFGLPSILGLELRDAAGDLVGHHAATVAGYSIPSASPPGTSYVSDRINELYLHDDQVGPFARAKIVSDNTLESQYPTANPPVMGKIWAVMIPVYEKIRITYEQAVEEVLNLEWLLRALGKDVEWDIRLRRSVDFQAWALGSDIPDRCNIVEAGWPRFIWQATGHIKGAEAVDVIMDATDIHRSFFVQAVYFHDGALKKTLTSMLKNEPVRTALRGALFPEEWVELLRALPD